MSGFSSTPRSPDYAATSPPSGPSTMTNTDQFPPDDPRLTAFALGELEGEELAAVEAALRDDPAARAAVEEIRATAAQLEAALGTEPMVPPVAAPLADPYARKGKLLHFPQ